MYTILFLEDDALLAQSVVEELEQASYRVHWVQEGDDAIEAVYDKQYNLYLLDVNVPGISGFELLNMLRQSGDHTPAIFLTSRNQIDDLSKGFEVGADDYIKKPFDLQEMLVRIASKMPKSGKEMLSKHVSIEASSLTLWCETTPHKLPAKEFALLAYLGKHINQYVGIEELLDEMGRDKPITIATLRTYIKNLKRHLHGYAQIKNLKGVGYRFSIV